MEVWDDDFREPTEDEKSARRVLALAIGFINAHRPLTSTEIHREFYPVDMGEATFRKTFLRDRKRLASAGLILRNGKKVDDFQTWEVDAESSFVSENRLTTEDALMLDILLLPLASDSSYPYARDLRLALAKIDRSFDGTSEAVIPPDARRRNANISRLEDCMSAGHAAKIGYRRADGSTLQRIVEPYGFFFLHSNTYMVAAKTNVDDPPHTYRLDRVTSVVEQPKIKYTRPGDFDVRDFILLPFQIGDRIYDATFATSDNTVIHEYVCDEDLAATWAITQGHRPLEPSSLVRAWRAKLQRITGGSNGA